MIHDGSAGQRGSKLLPARMPVVHLRATMLIETMVIVISLRMNQLHDAEKRGCAQAAQTAEIL